MPIAQDDILSITDNLTFLSLQTDILSCILSDREFDSPPFIRILLFLAALNCSADRVC